MTILITAAKEAMWLADEIYLFFFLTDLRREHYFDNRKRFSGVYFKALALPS